MTISFQRWFHRIISFLFFSFLNIFCRLSWFFSCLCSPPLPTYPLTFPFANTFFPFSLMLRVGESTLGIYCHRNTPISKYLSWCLHNFDYIHSTISIFSFKWFLFNYFKKFSIVRSTMFFIVLCRNDPGNFFVLKIKWDIIKTTYLFLLFFFVC